MQPRQIVLGPPPPPQFQNVWGNQSMETYVQPPAVMNPVTQYVQVRLHLTLILNHNEIFFEGASTDDFWSIYY